VIMSDLTITNGLAQGGSSGSGGGGAGMGGGLFIYDGNVTLDNVTFSDNRAIGGLGGDSGDGGFGGGGGFGGFEHYLLFGRAEGRAIA
ncbi:MAG: hypothetical protein AAF773_26550, partial [Cyanobacteria bacterium P01_D01_bin.115]